MGSRPSDLTNALTASAQAEDVRWRLSNRPLLLVLMSALAGAASGQQLPDTPVRQTADANSVPWQLSLRPHTLFGPQHTIAVPQQGQHNPFDLAIRDDTTQIVSRKPIQPTSAVAAVFSHSLKKKCQVTFKGYTCGVWSVPLTLFGMMQGERASDRANRLSAPSYRSH